MCNGLEEFDLNRPEGAPQETVEVVGGEGQRPVLLVLPQVQLELQPGSQTILAQAHQPTLQQHKQTNNQLCVPPCTCEARGPAPGLPAP